MLGEIIKNNSALPEENTDLTVSMRKSIFYNKVTGEAFGRGNAVYEFVIRSG